MATILENQASISYLYDGITDALGATSNIASTVLTDACSVTITKTALSQNFRNGDTVSYIIRIENTGSAALGDVTLTDDLAAGALVYLPNSLNVYVNGTLTPITPTTAGTTLSFVLPGTLAAGDVAIAVYSATANSAADSITNTSTITGTGQNPAVCSVTETASATITEAAFADLAIYKSSSPESVTSGDTLTYTFTILNNGNSPATNVVLTDTLPSAFQVATVSVTSGGVTTVYADGEYTLDPTTNTITLPTGTGAAITVPAATAQGPGVATVTITGRVI